MEELLHQYWEYHSNTENDLKITKESLMKQCREFLSSVKPEDRFVHLNIDFYRNVLDKICQNEDHSESNEEIMQRIMTGFKSLENYAVNLWKFPWRKEYHSIKLYTASFKCNIEKKLKDTEAIFDLLKSLGYTMMEQQKVSIKESEKQHVIWASLSIFLVQVDLKVIKEIMDHFPNNEFTLNEIVRVRSKTSDVGDAVHYLRRKAAKRRKTEELRGDDAPSHGHTKDTHIERAVAFNNLQSDIASSDAETSADQNTRRPSKLSALSKGREDVAVDSDDSSTGSAMRKMHPSFGVYTGYGMPPGTTGGHYFISMNSERLNDKELYGVSAQGGQPQHNLDARHSTAPQAGTLYDANKYTSDARYNTFPQTASGSLSGPNQYNVDTDYSKDHQASVLQYSANRKETQRYHRERKDGHPQFYDSTIKDRMDSATATFHSPSHHTTVTPSHSSHQHSNQSYRGFIKDDLWRHTAATQGGTVEAIANSGSNGYQPKMSARTEPHMHGSSSGDARYVNLQDVNSCADDKFGSNELEKATYKKDSVRRHDDEGVKHERTRGSRPEPTKVEQREYSRGSRSDAASLFNGVTEGACALGVTGLNATLQNHLTLEPKANLADKEVTGASTEQRDIVSAQETTRCRSRTTKEARPTRSLYENESNFSSTKEVGQKTVSSAAGISSDTAKKIDAKCSSPVPSRKHSTDCNQTPAYSSKNDPGTETPQKTHVKHDNAICDQCMLQGTIICRNCFRIICRKCKHIFSIDLCGATKGEHAFVDIKGNMRQKVKSVDSKAPSSQHYANVNEDVGNEEKDWSCSRCTYLNPPDHRICSICAASRGVGAVDEAKPGSKVCRSCTLNNEEGAKVCVACHKTLCNSETVV